MKQLLKKIGAMGLLWLGTQLECHAQFWPDYGQNNSTQSYTHETNTDKWTDRLIPGGNFALNFSQGYSLVDVSPSLLYAFTPKFAAGAGVNYLYRNFKYGNGFSAGGSNYGGRLLARYTVYKNIFASAEFMALNVITYKLATSNETERVWFINPMIGGGTYLPLGGRTVGYVSIFYNLNQNQRLNPYNFFGTNAFNIQIGLGF